MFASLPSPSSNGVEIGPLDVRFYGLCYVAAVVAAVFIAGRRWHALGGERRLAEDIALWGFPAGLLGGRLYFVITSWSDVPDEWWGVFAVWEGGLGLPGGIAAGVLVGVWRLRRLGVDVPLFMDAAAPGILVAQAIGRVGNWFNQELYGRPTNLPWGLEISPGNRPERYAGEPTFHPVFLYEIVWDPRARRRTGVARAPRADPAARALRPLCRGIRDLPRLHRNPPGGSRQGVARPAAQLLRDGGRLHSRDRVVRSDAARSDSRRTEPAAA